MFNIVLEGCDATGKSTLAKVLSDELEMLVVQGSSFENATGTNEDLFKHFTKVSNARNIIFDRSIYSNYVYATLYNDYSILSDEQRAEIEKKIKNNTIVIYLSADEQTIKDRIGERGDDYIKTKDIKGILELYSTAIDKAKKNGVIIKQYDTSKLTTEEIAKDIVNRIKS